MTPAGKRSIWRWLSIGALALIVIAATLLATHRPPALPPVVLLAPGYNISRQKGSIPERWIPRSWGWFWRIKQRIFGAPKTITIGATILEFPAPPQNVLYGFALGEPALTNSSGLRVWLTDESVLRALRKQIESSEDTTARIVASPRITTADGMQCQMGMTSRVTMGGTPVNVGIVLDSLARVRHGATDLTAILTATDAITNDARGIFPDQSTNTISVQTNLAVAARIQIPHGKGVLLLDASHSSQHEKITGLIISADSANQKTTFRERAVVTRVVTPPANR